jgi:valyl-tRNA synthetase
MIMMGLEYRGEAPFRDVIIHPTILASDGRRMSKSLGTGVDPLDLIGEFGADATRFGLAYMSSVQDVRFSAERIEMGRNFANKIWNASRLVIQGAHPDTQAEAHLVTPADRWIFSRLLAVQEEVEGLYESYDFAEVARVLYRFIWNEICDWYLEIAKARLYGEHEAARLQVSANLTLLLERVLALLHPLMPFVTEEIYRNLPQVRKGEAAPGLFGSRLVPADPSWRDPGAEAAMEAFIAVTSGLRSAREELGLGRETIGRVHLVTDDGGITEGLSVHASSLRQLAASEIASQVGLGQEPAGRFASIEGAPGLRALLALEGMVDVERERGRLLSGAEKARAEAVKARKKLDNEGFVRKAPPEVVDEERGRLSAAEARLDEIRRQYRERIGEELPE